MDKARYNDFVPIGTTQLSIQHEADANARNWSHSTPLHLAS